jgi:hypothetical protein
MNNEPVAWMVNDKPYQDIFEAEHYSKFTNKPMIPLYTHPHSDKSVKAKTLTDEEIMDETEKSCLTVWVAINPMLNVDSQKETAKKRMIEFARAILRKAQEK